jgi:hypothetical protein
MAAPNSSPPCSDDGRALTAGTRHPVQFRLRQASKGGSAEGCGPRNTNDVPLKCGRGMNATNWLQGLAMNICE